MGDIVRTSESEVVFSIDVHASAPVERIEIRNGLECVSTWRPFSDDELGRRIRVVWEGSEYRGRGRETIWDGSARLRANAFERVCPVNRYNPDKRFEHVSGSELRWQALTTGGFGGFDAWLADKDSGMLGIDTALVRAEIPVKDIRREDLRFDVGGIRRRIRVFRLPDANERRRVRVERRIPLRGDGDNALYACVTQEDGHLIWSSPIYIFN
jgi:hypothetical protein